MFLFVYMYLHTHKTTHQNKFLDGNAISQVYLFIQLFIIISNCICIYIYIFF